jgi:hypothetical protein
MLRLGPQSERTLFAPLIWRLALKTEQVTWSEIAGSPTEAVYVLMAARRLFKHDIHCVSFDTWLEAEAAGFAVERDDWGGVVRRPATPSEIRPAQAILDSDPILRNVEIIRRLALDGGGAIPAAAMTAPATMHARFGAERGDEVRDVMLGLARAYCEAGAGALLLLDEEPPAPAVSPLLLHAVRRVNAMAGRARCFMARRIVDRLAQPLRGSFTLGCSL